MKLKYGDLVSHDPKGSPIENILRKLGSLTDEGDIFPDFSYGLIVEKSKTGRRMKVYSPEIKNLCWYDNEELKLVV